MLFNESDDVFLPDVKLAVQTFKIRFLEKKSFSEFNKLTDKIILSFWF